MNTIKGKHDIHGIPFPVTVVITFEGANQEVIHDIYTAEALSIAQYYCLLTWIENRGWEE